MKQGVYEAIGRVPPSIAADVPVRYWHQGLFMGIVGFLVAYTLIGVALFLITPHADRPFGELVRGLGYGFHLLTLGISPAGEFPQYVADHRLVATIRIGIAWLAGLSLGGYMAYRALIPRKNMWVVDGPRLLSGKEAIREAHAKSLPERERNGDTKHLALHPDLILSKKQLSTHMIVVGGVGAGKTQVLLRMIRDIIKRDDKLFLYDVKGDFTAKFKRPIIVSPFDKRSWVWDVAKDVRTTIQANAFADSLIPEDKGSGKFWTDAARQIFIGVLRSLQNDMDGVWTWRDLATRLTQQNEAMSSTLWENYRRAYNLLGGDKGGTTAFNVLATLNGHTRLVDDLARAWPERIEGRLFSITDWVKDDYKGKKQVIVQAGEDKTLTGAYIAAMLNVAVPSIISPKLPDNESGRFLGFVLDEFSSIGVVNFMPLADKGRSKGVVLTIGLQDMEQMKRLYGDNETRTMMSLVGTQVICRVQQGETRDYLSKLFGTNKTAILPHGPDAKVHTEGRSVVFQHQLTDDLGFRKGKEFGPIGWGIRAIVYMGGNPMLLDFPGIDLPNVRRGQVAAPWTLGKAGKESERTVPGAPEAKAPKTPVKGLSDDEIEAMLRGL